MLGKGMFDRGHSPAHDSLAPVWNILFRNAWFPLRPSLQRARAASVRQAEVSPSEAVGATGGSIPKSLATRLLARSA